ncbi:hypothetical protein EPUL_006227, partial [Erysiphe pulchra]
TTPITEENQSTEEISSLQLEMPTEDFPPLPSTQSSTQSFTLPDQYTESTKSILMSKSRGLLNLVGPYLEEMEKSCPEAGVSRAIRGERIYAKLPLDSFDGSASEFKGNIWATKVANSSRCPSKSSPRGPGPPSRPTPPQGQSKEDRRIKIRLSPDHEARKAELLLLRKQLQRLIPDPTLVVDAWQVPSGISIFAPTPAKAATILQYKDAIALRFGNATFER